MLREVLRLHEPINRLQGRKQRFHLIERPGVRAVGELAPRSQTRMLSAPDASRAFSTTFRMSHGERNWPFLMFTERPALATARMKSVWRHRNAGVCSTSTAAAAAGISS